MVTRPGQGHRLVETSRVGALGQGGPQKDSVAPVRGAPDSPRGLAMLLLLGVLHVCHQGGGHRQRARR